MPENIEKTRARKARYVEKQKQEKGEAYNEERRLYMKAYREKKKQEAIKAKNEQPKPKAKLNEIQKTAALKLAGAIRSKLEANILQPAIFSDLYGSKLKQKNIESQLPDIPDLMNVGIKKPPPPPPAPIVAVATKKGRGRPKKVIQEPVITEKRPRGRPRKLPLTNTEQKMENIIINKL